MRLWLARLSLAAGSLAMLAFAVLFIGVLAWCGMALIEAAALL